MKQRDDWHLTDAVHNRLGQGDPFAAAVRGTRMPMVITDPTQPDNPIVFCNEAFQTLTGYAREEIIGHNCRFLQGPETDGEQVAKIREAIAEGRAIDVDLLNYRKDGTTFWNALYLSPVRDETGVIQYFFASQLDVSERVEAQAAVIQQRGQMELEVQRRTADLEAALEAKTLLLHEVDHRVKNNLTMIGSLLRLQARTIADPVITAKLEAMLERVDALATVHRRLYQAEDITKFDVGAFAANLAEDVVGSSGRSNIVVRADVEPIEVPSAKAAALGLVLNEILTNSIKHAFPAGRAGALTISARQRDGRASIVVADDGPGLPAQDEVVEGLGLTLIKRLSRQVGAEVEWGATGLGARIALHFLVSA